VIEADETCLAEMEEPHVAPRRTTPFTKGGKSGGRTKRTIVSLAERGGEVRSFHLNRATEENVSAILRENVAKESRLHTDESRLYEGMGAELASHETVFHSREEYARGDVTTNTVEGFFGVFKRGTKGTYQQRAEKHSHRYLAEFDFRYNNRVTLGVNDVERTRQMARGIVGKRLTYRTVNSGA
jgi:transposase-like protein